MNRAYIFDLDGTLVDSYLGIAEAYRFTFEALHIKGTEELDMHQFVGPSIREVLSDHFELDGSQLEEGVAIFRSHYGAKGLFRFTKYDGIDEVLRSLKDDGSALYIATGKLWTMAEQVIEHAGWNDLFSVVGGAEPDGSRYLKKDVIAWTLARIPVGESPSAMVGDRAADMTGGQELGLRPVGVAWGYGSRGELEGAGATTIAATPDVLLTTLRTSP